MEELTKQRLTNEPPGLEPSNAKRIFEQVLPQIEVGLVDCVEYPDDVEAKHREGLRAHTDEVHINAVSTFTDGSCVKIDSGASDWVFPPTAQYFSAQGTIASIRQLHFQAANGVPISGISTH